MQRLLTSTGVLPSLARPGPSLVRSFPLIQRQYSAGRRPGFFSQVVDNIRQEMQKSKEIKENVKKFREEAQRLEQSDALQAARKKFNTVESEASKGGEALKENLDKLRGRVTEAFDEASRTELGRKAGQLGEDLSRKARDVSETLAEKGQVLGQSGAFRGISETAKVVRDELDRQGIEARVYRSPAKLRKRVEVASDPASKRAVEPNADATGVELHKDSQFYQSWEVFKNNNQYVNKVLSWKMKYDESENPMVRASRLLTDKMSDIMGNLFSKTELSETLTEICRIDPSFDTKQFLRDCENDIIPNVLESIVRGDLEVLRDWCFESTYNIIATPITQALKAGYRLDSKILDIENVDLVMGKVMDQGPVLIVTFQTQQVLCVRDVRGTVIEGDPEKVMRCHHVWVLCRDPSELNPRSAWRLMEMSANSTEQFV
ncbi:mitochondrial import inner membrane translocase subunit TIM44-like [Anopheles cruzii]|uniref:mitochondrial import inner membrane translocase subunit TIM44-like n=1 Tax=Anopheles cruzii TaxID=68878 RepID=UPI0022EC27CF|nr:mitochondrial import inner membrane translocase subunit TIM44-like [Anopheles cruzii]